MKSEIPTYLRNLRTRPVTCSRAPSSILKGTKAGMGHQTKLPIPEVFHYFKVVSVTNILRLKMTLSAVSYEKIKTIPYENIFNLNFHKLRLIF